MMCIMLDLETMDSSSTSAIVSIGAAQFNMETGQIGSKFYVNVNLKSCIDAGLTLSASTIMWWMDRDKETQEVLKRDTWNIEAALPALSNWFALNGGMSCQIWANSPSFDCVILKNAFTACKMQLPWNYWNERDCRTLVAFNPDIKKGIINDLAHDALSDCLYQIKYCSAIWNTINVK